MSEETPDPPDQGVKVRSEEDIASDGEPAKGPPFALRGFALVVLVLIVACLGGAVASWIAAWMHPDPEPTETLVVRPTPDVIVAVRDLARLETTSYHVERVIDLTATQRRMFGLVEAEDSILLVAASDVVAGVDLTEMRDGDVVIEPDAHRAIITLPRARILSSTLDNERTYVHSRETDMLARRRESLETEARREAERTLESAALESGILERAERNAARTIESLVRSLGYQHVEVRFRQVEVEED
jgi:hypothetical protein